MARDDQHNDNESSDEYEEVYVVAELNGVLDPIPITRALAHKDVALRFADTNSPMIQVGPSLFGGNWSQTIGTDMIFAPKQSNTSETNRKEHELVAVSNTRLITNKLIVSDDNQSTKADAKKSHQKGKTAEAKKKLQIPKNPKKATKKS
ncbi:TFIIIC-sub6 domain-containing protein [Aphelenchoides besseyi]|nr:TFIIIC-sub6 domain-containing protein [Aphelenchoides besseyi]KAI6207912.1 TFIIIC-sub6 domain-containing protein [Aphelenchoides besseyi]